MSDEKQLIPAQPTSITAAKPEPANRTQWLAQYASGVIDEREFQAYAGLSVAEATDALSEEAAAEVQREIVRLRLSGELAQLRAALLTEKAVKVADDVMSDPEMHAGQRLSAAEQVHKVAGTLKGPVHREGSPERVFITINIPREDGSLEQAVAIEATRVVSTQGEDQ